MNKVVTSKKIIKFSNVFFKSLIPYNIKYRSLKNNISYKKIIFKSNNSLKFNSFQNQSNNHFVKNQLNYYNNIDSKYNINNSTLNDRHSLTTLINEINFYNKLEPYSKNLVNYQNIVRSKNTINYQNLNEYNIDLIKSNNIKLKNIPIGLQSIRVGLVGTKVGMTSLYGKWGERIPVSVIKIENNQVTNVKIHKVFNFDQHSNGRKYDVHKVYNNTYVNDPLLNNNKFLNKNYCNQISKYFVEVGGGFNPKLSKAEKGRYYKYGIPPKDLKHIFKVTEDCLLPIGYCLSTRHFKVGQYVDVQGLSKGKGTEGVMARWGFSGGVKTHGNSLAHRSPGSIGNREFPARVWPGKKMAGKTGNKKIWVMNLKLIKSDYPNGLLYIKGAIPGTNDSKIIIRDSIIKHLNQHKLLEGPTFIPALNINYKDIEIYYDEIDPFEKHEHDNNERLGISDEEEEGPVNPEDEDEL